MSYIPHTHTHTSRVPHLIFQHQSDNRHLYAKQSCGNIHVLRKPVCLHLTTRVVSRPCKRCISVGKDDTCRDVEHKKRGRPKLVDKTLGAWGPRKDISADPLSTDTAKAASLAKTRVKGKYTKSANYKMPKKINHPHTSSDHIS